MALLQPSKSLTVTGELEESYGDGGTDLLWSYKLPKTVVKVMGLPTNRVTASDESICIMDGDDELYFRVGMESVEEYDAKTGLYVLPKAVLPVLHTMSSNTIDAYDDTLGLIGMMKGDVVIAAQLAEDPETATEVYVTTPKVYLRALQKLKRLGYTTDSMDMLKQYVEHGKRAAYLDVKDVAVESEVDLC